MAIQKENTAAKNVISKNASMPTEQMIDERKYMATMTVFYSWYKKGVISKKEYCQIATKMKAKYGAKYGTLWFGSDLL